MQENQENNQEKSKSDLVKYSAMGFQMIAIIGLFTYGGYKLDEINENKQHLYTAIFSLVGVLLALFQVIRSARSK